MWPHRQVYLCEARIAAYGYGRMVSFPTARLIPEASALRGHRELQKQTKYVLENPFKIPMLFSFFNLAPHRNNGRSVSP